MERVPHDLGACRGVDHVIQAQELGREGKLSHSETKKDAVAGPRALGTSRGEALWVLPTGWDPCSGILDPSPLSCAGSCLCLRSPLRAPSSGKPSLPPPGHDPMSQILLLLCLLSLGCLGHCSIPVPKPGPSTGRHSVKTCRGGTEPRLQVQLLVSWGGGDRPILPAASALGLGKR